MVFYYGSGINPLFLCDYIRRCLIAKSKQKLIINEMITVDEVRLINENGEQLGIVSTDKALDMAYEKDLDLVLLSNDPKNAVAKMMNYGKFIYEQSKREREARKNQQITSLKEVQIKLTTEEHDTNVKAKNALRFLENGDRVRVVIRFRGREMAFQNQGYEVMHDFLDRLGDAAKLDRAPSMEGRHMVMYLSANKEKE